MNTKIQDPLTDQFMKAILTLKTMEDGYRFFEDIATISEIKSLAQRLEVARMLQEKYTYDVIVEKTGASTATISRVKKCLHYGADGYQLALERLKNS